MKVKKDEMPISLRITPQTHIKLKLIAQKELRSLNRQIEYFILQGIEAYENTNGKLIDELSKVDELADADHLEGLD